jgi:hypothetical protein
MIEASPIDRLRAIFTTGFAESTGEYLTSFQVTTNVVAGAAFFLVSWVGFNLLTRTSKDAGPARGLLPTSVSRLRGLGVGRVWRLALAWKDFFFVSGGVSGIIVRFAALAALLGLVALVWGPGIDAESFGAAVLLIMLGVGFVEALVQATRIFRVEAQWRTLPALVMLPKSVHEIVYAKALGCMIGFVPYAVYGLLGLLLCVGPFFKRLGRLLEGPQGWFAIWLIGLGVLAAILVLHVAAFMSLVVTRASLVVALGACAAVMMFLVFFTMPLMIVGGEVSLAFNCMVLIVLVGLLHWGTLKLIEFKATQ